MKMIDHALFAAQLWRGIRCGAAACFLLLATMLALTAHGQTTWQVAITGYSYYGNGYYNFSPSTVDANVGDSVEWTWNSGDPTNPHSTTSANSLWDSGVSESGDFTYTFTTAGDFSYYCSFHYFYGDVNVSMPVTYQPPTASITSPADGAVFAAPASFNFAATASDPNSGGSVSYVYLYKGASLVGNVSTPPYSTQITGLGVGDYTLTATAYDNFGQNAGSTPITVHVVTPVAVSVTAAARKSGTSFQFTYSANAGLNYVVEVSTNLVNWRGLNTNTATAGTMVFTDTNATSGRLFYRVGRMVPN